MPHAAEELLRKRVAREEILDYYLAHAARGDMLTEVTEADGKSRSG